MFQEFGMIGSVSLTFARRVYSAKLEYDSLLGRGLRGVWRRLEAQLSTPLGEAPTFAAAQTIGDVTIEIHDARRALSEAEAAYAIEFAATLHANQPRNCNFLIRSHAIRTSGTIPRRS